MIGTWRGEKPDIPAPLYYELWRVSSRHPSSLQRSSLTAGSVGVVIPLLDRPGGGKLMKSFLISVILVLASAVIAAAQQKHPMTVEDVIAIKNVSDAQVSP